MLNEKSNKSKSKSVTNPKPLPTTGEQLLDAIKRKGIPTVKLDADENGYIIIDKEKHPDLYDWAKNG